MSGSSPHKGDLPFARIGRPRGNKGEVILHPYFELKEEDFIDAEVTASWSDGKRSSLQIDRLWRHGEKLICHFKDYSTISSAKELRNAELSVPRERLSPLEDEEYYAADLIGCKAVTVDGTELGHIGSVTDTAGSAVLAVVGEREYLIPLAREIVIEMDVESKLVVVKPPPGLLEINES